MKRTAFALLGVVTFLVACSRAEPVRAVKVITVGSNAYRSRLEFAGEVKAQVESRLGFRVGGKIIKRQA